MGAKYLGMGGACAGASVSCLVAKLVEPLVRVLSKIVRLLSIHRTLK